MKEEAFEKQLFWVISIVAAAFTLGWCSVLGSFNSERTSMALATCSAAFAAGSLIGFIFTIFGEEIEPLGKIRDAMIALASGIAGIGIAKVSQIGALLGSIQLFTEDTKKNSWFAVLFVITYFVAGFYFMYLMRKLVLNPVLAKSRIEIERIQISGSVSFVAEEIGKRLPSSVLLGRDYIEGIVEDGGKMAEHLGSELFGEAVTQFLAGCEKDLKTGSPLSPDNVSKAAVIHYYRIYFEKDEARRETQQGTAIEWINRAILRDPLDPAFQIKLADIFGMQERFAEAASIFERLERDEDAPQFVQQWLGYFLLFIDGREVDAIRHSLEYQRRFPDSDSALFNASCGYAQLYTIELRNEGVTELLDSENRKLSLSILEKGIRLDPGLKATARKHCDPGDSYADLASDPDFLRITSATPDSKVESIQ